ncbi:unnamed protein product [Amoebophrya sp. A25]|nr:unnamed protein product [Amoebophrya sp. A25]|eukprot:GSA25T00028017001.1
MRLADSHTCLMDFPVSHLGEVDQVIMMFLMLIQQAVILLLRLTHEDIDVHVPPYSTL